MKTDGRATDDCQRIMQISQMMHGVVMGGFMARMHSPIKRKHTAPGADAIALLEVDEELPAQVLKQVRGLAHIKQAALLKF